MARTIHGVKKNTFYSLKLRFTGSKYAAFHRPIRSQIMTQKGTALAIIQKHKLT